MLVLLYIYTPFFGEITLSCEKGTMNNNNDFEQISRLAAEMCKDILRQLLNYDNSIFAYDDIYVSGSMVAVCVAMARAKVFLKEDISIHMGNVMSFFNDVDMYSTNKMKLLITLPQLLDFRRGDIVNVVFDRIEEILDTYDCTMVKCAYHLASNKLVGYDQHYVDTMMTRNPVFEVNRINTLTRFEKLEKRAREWFKGIVKLGETSNTTIQLTGISSHNDDDNTLPSAGCLSIGEWYGNRLCVGCKKVFKCDFHKSFAYHAYVCNDCYKISVTVLQSHLNAGNQYRDKSVLVIGGSSGVGRVIVEELIKLDVEKLTVTTRRDLKNIIHIKNEKYIQFTIGESKNQLLFNALAEADVIIFNAWPMVEGDINNWTHTINNFPQDEFYKRFQVINGYVIFLNLMAEAIRKAQTSGNAKHRMFVMMDSDETKYCRGKIMTGRHLICNMTKACQKMATGTIAKQLAFLNVRVIFYDPGWLSISMPPNNLDEDIMSTTTPSVLEAYITSKTLGCEKKKPNTDVEVAYSTSKQARLDQYLCNQVENCRLSVMCLLHTCVSGWVGSTFCAKKRRPNYTTFVEIGQKYSYYSTLEAIHSHVKLLNQHIASSHVWVRNADEELYKRWYPPTENDVDWVMSAAKKRKLSSSNYIIRSVEYRYSWP